MTQPPSSSAMDSTSLDSDLQYIAEMARAGEEAPLLGGRFLAWFGGLTGLAYIGHYMIAEGIIGGGAPMFGYMWLGYGVVAVGGYFLLLATFGRGKPGQSSPGNRAESAVWMAGGIALGTYFITSTIAAMLGNSGGYDAFLSSLPFVFGVYAIGMITSGAVSKISFLTLAGIAALATMAAAIIVGPVNEMWLVAGAGALISVFLPGLMLLRREPSSTV